MKSIVFAVAKGGVGKSLLMVNVGAALALKGHKVAMVEGDPTNPLQLMLGLELPKEAKRLQDVVQKNLNVETCVHKSSIENLFVVPSGVSLADFFTLNPVRFAEKLGQLDHEFVFVDIPFPMGEAATLALGFCYYFIPIVTEDEFVPCVSGAIETLDVARSYLACQPIGYVLNNVKNAEKFDEVFVERLSDVLGIRCIGIVKQDVNVSKSFGGAKTSRPFVAYSKYPESEFAREIYGIASLLAADLPQPLKENPVNFIRSKITQTR